MFHKFLIASVLGLGLIATSAPKAEALVPSKFPIGRYRVEYRQLQWRENTFGSFFQARNFADQKRAQGFQVDVDQHGFHWHVRYRMPHWQLFRVVNNHQLAHQIEHDLEHRGFDARVVH